MCETIYGALCYNNSYNLGDNIQSLAAIQYLPMISYWIDRDTSEVFDLKGNKVDTDKFPDGFKIKCIYNGWFDGQYCKFPPPKYIDPLFISFHINETSHINDKRYNILDNNKIKFKSITLNSEYFSKHGSVGCRDLYTYDLLKRNNIDCYFSACLTLTLKKEHYLKEYSDKILVIDAYIDCPDLFDKLHSCLLSNLPNFYNYITGIKSDKIEYISQALENVLLDNNKKLTLADKLLQKIAGAKLVITSRLHSALPAIAFNVPVIFLNNNMDDVRFRGLINSSFIDRFNLSKIPERYIDLINKFINSK